MLLEILTPEKDIFTGEASLVQLPGLDGLFAILDKHAPMIAALKQGTVRVETPGGTKYFEITGGVLEVKKNKALILVE